jgi:dTDP-4-dehydrorhamnose 3,5-epimerase-like enzyme
MANLDDYLTITHLASVPPKMDGRQLGFVKGEKGETAFLNVNAASQTVMVFEAIPGKVRGGHYHVGKQEWSYVINGELTAYFWLPEAPENVLITVLKKSDLVHIKPGLAHAYVTDSHALVLEQSDCAYDPAQTIIVKELPKSLKIN